MKKLIKLVEPDKALSMKSIIRGNLPVISFLVILSFSVYLNSLGNKFVSDDIPVIKLGQQIRNFSLLFSNPFDSMRNLVLWVVFSLFGPNPTYFRLLNIMLHLLNTILVFILITKLHSKTTAFFASSIFAVHSIHVEAIAWISGGSYVQLSFFFLLSFILYLFSNGNKKMYIISILFYVLALESQTLVAVLSAVFAVYELTLGNIKLNYKKIIPFLILGLIWGTTVLFAVPKRLSVNDTNYYYKGRVENPVIQLPYVLTEYFKLSVWPSHLTIYQSELGYKPIEHIIRSLILLTYVILVLVSLKLNKKIFFWNAFLLVSLLPTLTPFHLTSIMAERYIYLGSIGLFTSLSLIPTYLLKTKAKEFVYPFFIIILIALSIRTIIRNTEWKNEQSLWTATLKASPSYPPAHNNMGYVYVLQGKLKLAEYEYTKAIEMLPGYAEAYNNLGRVYFLQSKYDLSIQNYKKALELNPNLWQTYSNIALAYMETDQLDVAWGFAKKSLSVNPNDPESKATLGFIYLKMNKIKEAEEIFRDVLNQNPLNPMAKDGLKLINEMKVK